MNFSQLLQPFVCACGKVHSCEIEQIVIRPGALDVLPALVAKEKEILLVADTNTYGACGEQVAARLQEKHVQKQIFDCEGFLIPDEDAIAQIRQELTDQTTLILGVGSGVIQDLCKYVSFQAGLPYVIVATAPSMDGYASKGAAMILDHMKITATAHVPKAIIGDVDILKLAPMDMIRSGYGDILGKFSCLNDWKLGQVVLDEYFCQHVYDMTWDMLQRTKDLGPSLQVRDPEAIQTLMEALIGIGVAMAYVGNSRPGSGSEHHLSHFFEITGILNQQPYLVHGTDVAYSAVVTQQLREELLRLETPEPSKLPSRDAWEAKIRELYTQAADGVIALQDQLGWYQTDRASRYAERWQEICQILREPPDALSMEAYLISVGFDPAAFEALYGPQKIRDAVLFAKDLKDRYSVLWMYYDLLYDRQSGKM